MPIHITKSEILTSEKREHVELMDDYGSVQHVYIPVLLGSTRQQVLQDHVTLMENHQAAMEAYATANGHDISSQKTAGIAKKQAAIAANKPAPFVPAQIAPAATPVPNIPPISNTK